VCKDSLFEWETEAMDEEKNGGNASEAHGEIQNTISILSDLSEEEVPNYDQHILNIFLQKAMTTWRSLQEGEQWFC